MNGNNTLRGGDVGLDHVGNHCPPARRFISPALAEVPNRMEFVYGC